MTFLKKLSPLAAIALSLIVISCSDFSNIASNDKVNKSELVKSSSVKNQVIQSLKTVEQSICNPPIGWKEAYYKSQNGIFLFGEWHGTREAPDIVVEYACAVAEATGGKTILLFEVNYLNSPVFETVISGEYNDAEETLKEGLRVFWNGSQDGRKSYSAMNAMLRVKEINDQGVNLFFGSTGISDEEFLAIYNKKIPMSELYNIEAKNILDTKKNYSNVITYTGNIHAARHANYFKKVGFDNFLALDYIFFGGKSWSCTPACGITKLTPYTKAKYLKEELDRSIVVNEDIDPVFKGFFITHEPTPIIPYPSNNN